MKYPLSIKIPLYKLYYVKDLVNGVHFDSEFINAFRNQYTALERSEILKALQWAVENPDFDYKNILPDISFDNTEIHQYLKELFDTMQRENL